MSLTLHLIAAQIRTRAAFSEIVITLPGRESPGFTGRRLLPATDDRPDQRHRPVGPTAAPTPGQQVLRAPVDVLVSVSGSVQASSRPLLRGSLGGQPGVGGCPGHAIAGIDADRVGTDAAGPTGPVTVRPG